MPCPLEASARFFLLLEDNLPRNFSNFNVEEGSIEEEEEVDITAEVRRILSCSYVNFIPSCFAIQWILVFNTNAFVYFVL